MMVEQMSQSVGAMRLYDIAEQCGMNPTTTLRFFTTTSREKLQKELLLAQIKGYACAEEERVYGMCCVAVPIRDYTNKIIAALNVGGPLTVMTREHVQEHMDLLRESADKISLCMGYDKTQQKDGIYQR